MNALLGPYYISVELQSLKLLGGELRDTIDGRDLLLDVHLDLAASLRAHLRLNAANNVLRVVNNTDLNILLRGASASVRLAGDYSTLRICSLKLDYALDLRSAGRLMGV